MGNKRTNERIWFKRWITEGYSIRQLALQSDHSATKLSRIINYWLSMKTPTIEYDLTQCRNLVFDGTFLHRPQSLVMLMEAGGHRIIKGEYGISENSDRQLISFFSPLVDRGLQPISCTVDGNPQVIRALKSLWPNIIIQRCIIHIQRQGLSWCRRNPKTPYARQLRTIFLTVPCIHSKAERNLFLKAVGEWEERYGPWIDSRPERGRVFSDIKRARSMLLRAIPNMFHYLDDPGIIHTTNGLEGYFSRLKNHYRQHRGLAKTKLHDYFDWYLYYVPK